METGINGAYFADSVQTGIDSWNDALDIDISITNSQNTAGILYYFGNAEEIEAHDYFSLVADTSGNTAIVTKTPKEQFTWSGNVKVGCQIHPIVYSAVVNCGLNQNETKKTATHELGHALGYFGHDTYNPTGGTMSVMTKGRSSDYTLNSRDICHLKQIYDLIKARGEFQ